MISNFETGEKSSFRPDMPGVSGKKIVIIGDAGGIGRATAALLVDRGAKVFMVVGSPAELTAAFAEIAPTGGEWDGMVVDLHHTGEIGRFFDQAEQRMGRIDVLISLLPAENGFIRQDGSGTIQSLCLKEALRRMEKYPGSQLISYGAAGRVISAALRREARDKGVRTTLIDPGAVLRREPLIAVTGSALAYPIPDAHEVARCEYQSVAQSFGADVIFLNGQKPGRLQ